MHHANFVHLHVHSYYSLLDGAAPISELAKRAHELKMPALAITDHGNLFGAVEFYQTLSKAGIKPCIGCEMYLLTSGSRLNKAATSNEGSLTHLTLLVKNMEGYKNLCRLITSSYLEGFYYKPRIDKEILRQYNSGLIALSGCLKGGISQALLGERWDDAVLLARELSEMFGNNRFFLEAQDQRLPEQAKILEGTIKLGKELGLPLVATNDVHYIRREDAAAHDALLCIQTGKNLSDEKRMRLGTDEFYFKTPEEMAGIFSMCPEAITNTLDVAARLNLEFDFKTYHFPKFAPPEGKNLVSYLETEALSGLERRWPHIVKHSGKGAGERRADYEKRLDDELKMIAKMGFAGYFLIVADFINYAKSKGLPVGPGRGSAAGSLVAFCLGITNLDPLAHDLLFERFLNPERVSMPDVDIDFCMRRRGEVIDYVSEKYGNVSQIITFGSMKARAVVRDVGRVMGLPYGDVDKIAKLIPAVLDMTLDRAIQTEPKLQELARKEPQVKRLLEIAGVLEGFPRHASTHAAGVVISDRPLTEFVPLYRGQNEDVVTQFDMKCIEKVGLIKFDFLGLKTLTVIDDCIKLIEAKLGEKIDIDDIAMDDALVFRRLSEGDTAGIFQLESSGMTDIVMKLKPGTFADVVALVALFRPGPLGSGMVDDFINRKHGRTAIKYDLAALEPILKETYGVIVYQEQVMRIANVLASYSLGEADILRRAMGKKKPEEMAKQRERFLSGAAAGKIQKNKAELIFDLMEKFAGYGFNKCVVGETELVDADSGEIITVSDLVKNGHNRRTLCLNDSGKLVPKQISAVMQNGRKRVYSLKTHLGHRIFATDNHPFLTIDGWKNLGDLKVGDRVAVPRVFPTEGKIKLPEHELISLAWILSEGNTCHPSSLYFYNNDKKLIDDFVTHIEKFPHTHARVYQRKDGRFEVCANTGIKSHTPWNAGVSARMKSQVPARSGAFMWAEGQGLIGKKATEKVIPPSIFSINNSQLALFLGRIWSGDGFIFGAGNTVPYYATSSPVLARQISHLLLRFGIISRITTKSFRYKDGRKVGYTVHLTGEGSVKKFLAEILPHLIGRDESVKQLRSYIAQAEAGKGCRDTIPWQAKKLIRDEKLASGKSWVQIESDVDLSMKELYGGVHAAKRGFRRDTIYKMGCYFHSQELVNAGTSDIYWDEIKEITKEGIRETYDITVDDHHNFVANGIVVHNSHSAAYALVAYQTAYLKYHHTTEYMAALLTTEKDNTDKILQYINDCRQHEVKILPPDINESKRDFSVVGEKLIRFGLAAVKNVGDAAIDSIVEVRGEGGPYKSLFNFCERVDSRRVNKRVIESLIKCGAFDFTKAPRAALLSALDQAMELAASHQRDRASGQARLFDLFAASGSGGMGEPELPDVSEWAERQLLAYEKESLGFYITGHPLAAHEALLAQYANTDTAELGEMRDSAEVRLGGVVAKMREITTKRGDRMGFVTLEDLKGSAEVVIFSDLYANINALIKSDHPLFVIGNADADGENVKIIAREILPIEEAPAALTKSVHFYLHQPEVTTHLLSQLKNILSRYPGGCAGFVHLIVPEKSDTVLALPPELKLSPTPQLVSAVDKLFGHNVTKFIS